MVCGQVSPEVCILKETKSKGSCLDLGKLADQLYNKKHLNIRMTNNITHAVEGELFLLLFSIVYFSVLVVFDFRFS